MLDDSKEGKTMSDTEPRSAESALDQQQRCAPPESLHACGLARARATPPR